MGEDIHVRIVQRDPNTDSWKQIKLYHKKNNKFKIVDIYPFRNYELFEILKSGNCFPYRPLSYINLPVALKNEIKKDEEEFCYSFKEVNLADMKIYLNKFPTIRDWDYEDNDTKAWKENPIKYFIDRIEQYIDMANPDYDFNFSYSGIKILYWFDH